MGVILISFNQNFTGFKKKMDNYSYKQGKIQTKRKYNNLSINI